MAFNVHFVLCSIFPVGELLTTCKGSRTSKLQYVRDLGEEQGDLYANTALLSDLYQKLGFMIDGMKLLLHSKPPQQRRSTPVADEEDLRQAQEAVQQALLVCDVTDHIG